MCWNKILQMLQKSYRQQFTFQISVCFSACFSIHLQSSTSKLIKIWSARCWIAVQGLKKKELTSGNHKWRTTKTPAPFKTLHVEAHGPSMSNYGISVSVLWCSHDRMRTWKELWSGHCEWLVLTDPIETTNIWRKLNYVNNLTTSGKYTVFWEFKNNDGRTNTEKQWFDDFATSQVSWKISPLNPITIDNYLTALFTAVSWNQIA